MPDCKICLELATGLRELRWEKPAVIACLGVMIETEVRLLDVTLFLGVSLEFGVLNVVVVALGRNVLTRAWLLPAVLLLFESLPELSTIFLD